MVRSKTRKQRRRRAFVGVVREPHEAGVLCPLPLESGTSPASRRRTQRPACAREAACNRLMAEENIESELLFRSEFHTGTNARRLAANLLDCSG